MSGVEKFKEMFDASQGNVLSGAKYIADRGTLLSFGALTEDELNELYIYYVDKHSEFGIDVLEKELFLKSLKGAIDAANNLAWALIKTSL